MEMLSTDETGDSTPVLSSCKSHGERMHKKTANQSQQAQGSWANGIPHVWPIYIQHTITGPWQDVWQISNQPAQPGSFEIALVIGHILMTALGMKPFSVRLWHIMKGPKERWDCDTSWRVLRSAGTAGLKPKSLHLYTRGYRKHTHWRVALKDTDLRTGVCVCLCTMRAFQWQAEGLGQIRMPGVGERTQELSEGTCSSKPSLSRTSALSRITRPSL